MIQPVKESRKEQRDRRPGPREGVTPQEGGGQQQMRAGQRQGGGGEEVSPLCNVIRKTTSEKTANLSLAQT